MTSPRRHLLRRALLCAALVGCTAPETGDAGADAADDVARVDGGRDVGERAAGFDTLFVGNSYVYVNDVAGHYRAAVGALSADVRVEEVTTGGYTLAQHAADARTDGTPLALALRRERAFDYVVLQEQSELGGYRNAGLLPERAESIAAALELASLARARDATVVLYQTWGREVGIPALGFFGFGTYPSMQDRLDYGYLDLATVLADQGIDVRIAPVGGAFRIVFDDLVREGVDPAAEGSDFDALYEPDGSHPSLRGAYLAACVIAGTVSRADVRTFADDPALGAEISARLRAVCARALAEPRWEVPAVSRPDEVMSGTTVGEMLGVSVAMSGDGLRLLFGSSADLVRVRARTTEGWIDEAEWGGATGFTDALALSSDGARALVGPPHQIHVRGEAGWSAEASLPTPPSWSPFSSPFTVALSEDGSRAIVGTGSAVDPTVAGARIFVRSGSTWALEAQLPPDDVLSRRVGVALDARGERALVSHGAVRVYVRSGSSWTEEAVLSSEVGTDAVFALSADGEHAGLGAAEQVVVLARSGSVWTEVATLRATGAFRFGTSVALSADARVVAVGSGDLHGTQQRCARVFVAREGRYAYEHVLIAAAPVPPGSEGDPGFGDALAMSADGRRIAIGAARQGFLDARNTGALYLYTLP